GSSAKGDGQSVDVVLASGIHEVRLSGTLNDAKDRIDVRWAGMSEAGAAPLAPIPAKYLYNGPTGGLSTEFAQYSGTADLTATDPLAGQPPKERRVYQA